MKYYDTEWHKGFSLARGPLLNSFLKVFTSRMAGFMGPLVSRRDLFLYLHFQEIPGLYPIRGHGVRV